MFILQVRVNFISEWNVLKFQSSRPALPLQRALCSPLLGPAPTLSPAFSRNSSALQYPACNKLHACERFVQELVLLTCISTVDISGINSILAFQLFLDVQIKSKLILNSCTKVRPYIALLGPTFSQKHIHVIKITKT